MSASHGRYAFEISTWSFFRELIKMNQRQRKFDMYLIVLFLFYIKKEKKEKKAYFFSLFLSDNKLFRPYMVFEFAHQSLLPISL